MSDILKSSIALVVEESGPGHFTAHEKIDEAIVIDIRPRSAWVAPARSQAILAGHIGKSSVTIIFQERHTLGNSHPPRSTKFRHPSLL
jgi:hypothetical protein